MLRVVKSPRTREPFFMKSARFIGTTAWKIHQVIINRWVRITVLLAAVYGLIKLTGISVEILRAGEIVVRIR